nr:hypothetical protein [Tanacetum cinerariifolium]
HASQLINPLSRETINLPKVDTFPNFSETSEWDMAISKLVLVVPSKLVVVLWGCSGKLGFCHFGDNKWNAVDEKGKIQYEVITMPKDLYDQDVDGAYIIGLDDDQRKRLLVVIREGMLDDIEDESCNDTYKTKSFNVFSYDDLGNGNWSKVWVRKLCLWDI